MKLLFITEFFTSPKNPKFSGGVETRTFYTVKHLSLNNQITVFARKKTGEKSFEKYNNLEIYRFGKKNDTSAASLSSLFSRLQFILSCLKKAKNIEIDLVEGSNFITFIPTIIISKLKKIPKIAWYPDTLKGKWIRQFGLVLGLIGEICESIFLKTKWDQIITISNSVRIRLQKFTSNNIKVVYCGTDFEAPRPKSRGNHKTSNFNFAESEKEIELSDFKKNTLLMKRKNQLKVEKNDQLLVISRLVKYKRVHWVINLLSSLRDRFPDLTLTIVGSGPEENNLKKLAQKLNLKNKIKFLKNISNVDLNKIISESKLLIHPSLIEGFGIVLVDSCKFGTPFISSDIPTALELNKILNSGLLFKQSNFNDLINQTKNLLKNKILYKKLSANGIKNSKKFNWKDLSAETEKIYLNVIKK